MFCPNCGKGEQTPDSFCRTCGVFLTDYSAKSFILNKLLGGGAPRTQLNYSMALNAVTAIISSFLLGFLKGHYDREFEKTGEGAPAVIYYVYVFLGLVITWQMLGFFINRRLKKKLDAGGQEAARHAPDALAPPPRQAQRPLPRQARRPLPEGGADEPVNRASEQTTRSLDKVPRRRSTSRDLR